jgi:uncharacterized membrane protein
MKICIECEKDVSGKKAVKIREDRIIQAIRKVKEITRTAQGNELYVCEEHVEQHKTRRKKFERSILIFGILAGVVVVLLVGMLLMSEKFDIILFIYSVLIGVFILAIAVIFRYCPGMENETPVLVGRPETRSVITESSGSGRMRPAGKNNEKKISRKK